MAVAASQGLCFVSSPHESGNQNPFLICHLFKTMLTDKEDKEMTMMMMMINQHNDRCKRVRKWIFGHFQYQSNTLTHRLKLHIVSGLQI